MVWWMPSKARGSSKVDRWSVPPPVGPDGKVRIDAPTAADLLHRQARPDGEEPAAS